MAIELNDGSRIAAPVIRQQRLGEVAYLAIVRPEQRDRLRKGWAKFRELTPEQQDALRDAYRRFQSLPPEQRNRLRERWQQMSPEERRRAINRRQGAKPDTFDKRPCPPC